MNGFMYCGSKMYELQSLTDKMGRLVVSQGGGSLADDADARFYVCNMDWDREDLEKLENEFSAICRALQDLAEIYRMEELPFGSCPAPEYVSPDSPEMKVWNIYFKESDTPEEPVQNMESENEDEYSEEISEAYLDLAEDRIGKGADRLQTWKTWNRGRRYCRLHELGAPSVVLKREEEDFAVDFVLHAFAKEIKPVSLMVDRYDPETRCFGVLDDSEMAQLLRFLGASPHLLPEKQAGYLLLMNSLYARDRAKLCDLTFHDFDRVKELCDGLLDELPKGEAERLREIYGLEDGVRRSEQAVGADCGLSGQAMYEMRGTALRKLRHPARLVKIRRLLELEY